MSNKDLQLRWLTVILFLLFIGECKSTKRIQRRFMWKQVDDTMDGILDSMASSARAMKSMIGEFMPAMTTAPTRTLLHGNILDYLPSETTKIKYIIRSPTIKPMKAIKMSAPKKVVKVMTMHKPIVETKHIKTKYNFDNAAALRQIEKEQELIAEGRLPLKTIEKNHKQNNDIVYGHIHEFNQDWQPVSTAKPNPANHLYTDGLNEALPQPEKQVYDPNTNENSYIVEETKRLNNYEVTEHTPEETVAVPFTQQYQNSRGFVPIPSTLTSHQQNTARSGQSFKNPISSKSTTTTTTTTTESPNYPESFLKKNRERIVQTSKLMKITPEINWFRSTNASISESRPRLIHHSQSPLKTQGWEFSGPTILPTMLALSTTTKFKPALLTKPTSEERLRPKATLTFKIERPRDIRQRGSVKFGDKLAELYKK